MAMTDRAVHNQRFESLKQMLEERRQEIVEKLRTIREAMPDQRLDVQDAEEQAVTDFAKDMEFALVQMKADTLGRIDEAMRRLEAGTYGECAECVTEITAARLKALPLPRCLAATARSRRRLGRPRRTRRLLRALPALEG